MKNPLVSVIVPTRNSQEHLPACLESILAQTYKNIELIVVDNNSTDATKSLAAQAGATVYNQGPERSAQVNYGVARALGEFVYKVDSDFVLEQTVVEECVAEALKGFDAVVVHNSPDTRVSWIARVRKFEVDMYKYNITHSSARFVRKNVYQKIGGFNQAITAGEDYDFQNKLNRAGYKTGFINAEALHLGEPKMLLPHLKKFYAYGRDFVNYKQHNQEESKEQLGFGRSVYFKNWRRFTQQPHMGVAFALYNSLKYLAGALGYAQELVIGKVGRRG